MKQKKIVALRPNTDSPEFDLSDFREEIDEMKISDEQAQQILQALWSIMSSVASIGWGVDIVQIVLPQLFGHAANDNEYNEERKQA